MVLCRAISIFICLNTLFVLPALTQSPETESFQPVRKAIAEDDYARAREELTQLTVSLRGNVDRAEVAELRRTIGVLEREFNKLSRSIQALETDPSNTDANQAVGEFYAFQKGDWEHALPLLAKGNNAPTRAAAQMEQQSPNDAKESLELGDLWADAANAARGADQQSQITLRARHWYMKAAADASEDMRSTIENRLHDLSFYPSKIIIVNSHNGHDNDRGTLLANVSLLLDGKVVHSQRLPMPWRRGESVPVTVRLGRVRANAVQIDVLRWQGSGGALAEVEVYQGHINLAGGAFAEASAEYDEPFDAAKINDGDHGDVFKQIGSWVLPNREAGWVRIDWTRLKS